MPRAQRPKVIGEALAPTQKKPEKGTERGRAHRGSLWCAYRGESAKKRSSEPKSPGVGLGLGVVVAVVAVGGGVVVGGVVVGLGLGVGVGVGPGPRRQRPSA